MPIDAVAELGVVVSVQYTIVQVLLYNIYRYRSDLGSTCRIYDF